ncbi:MAG TPA: glycosyltransferase, partial [Chloroflexota bacterium]
NIVVWVGRINPLKDLRTLIGAAALVKAKRPDVRFLLFGSAAAEDQAYYQDILALRAQLGVEDVVEFRGYIAQPVAAYNQGDIVALSSLSEAFPFSVLEAMLCARPVVATAVGGVPEEIQGCGIAVEPRNPRAMADAILELLDDPVRCAALGEAARLKAVEQFSLETCCGAHVASYTQLSAAAATKRKSVSLATPAAQSAASNDHQDEQRHARATVSPRRSLVAN